MSEVDIIIVGAGLAGSAAATVLARDGYRVALIDPKPAASPAFKAEKIEPDQAEILSRLGLLEGMRPHLAPIHSILESQRGRILRDRPIEQYGAPYQDIVNAVQRQLPPSVDRRVARAVEASVGDRAQTVTLAGGARIAGRLLVLAGGTGGRLHEPLGVIRYMVRDPQSMCSGFDIARPDGEGFLFDSVTYFGDDPDAAIDYLTLFRIPYGMRVNLFAYRDPKDPWFHRLAADAAWVLGQAMPGLFHVTGPWIATSKVESRAIDLYVSKPPPSGGMVLIGDACQSVCPATGAGLSKVLTDVELLCRSYVPAWLAGPGITRKQLAEFYQDPRKLDVDRDSLQAAAYRRQLSTDPSLRWWVHRRREYARLRASGRRERAAASL